MQWAGIHVTDLVNIQKTIVESIEILETPLKVIICNRMDSEGVYLSEINLKLTNNLNN